MEENEAVGSKRKNWAGNYTFTAENLYEADTVAEIQALVKQLGKKKLWVQIIASMILQIVLIIILIFWN